MSTANNSGSDLSFDGTPVVPTNNVRLADEPASISASQEENEDADLKINGTTPNGAYDIRVYLGRAIKLLVAGTALYLLLHKVMPLLKVFR